MFPSCFIPNEHAATIRCVDGPNGRLTLTCPTPSRLVQQPQFDFQRCSQVVIPVNARFDGQIWPLMPFSKQSYAAECAQLFPGIAPPDFRFFQRTFGQLDNLSHIIFTNGLYDPVYSQSLQQSIPANEIFSLTALASHTEDLRAPDAGDDPSLTALRNEALATAKRWIAQ